MLETIVYTIFGMVVVWLVVTLKVAISRFISKYIFKRNDEEDYEPLICGTLGGEHDCIHTKGWMGSCDDCPVYIEAMYNARLKRHAEETTELLRNTVREMMEEDERKAKEVI
ncbi:MAG: hypothetical protein NC548_56655 [Lachnospiraceae bacterium]|nr:hypothetical protein [Lachnospiraceae bacterium]